MPPNANVIENPGNTQEGTNAETLSGLNASSLQVSPSAVLVPPSSIFNGSVPTGTTLMSSNGRYQADFQPDGNLVIRDTTKTGSAAIIWSSGTDGKSEGGSLAVQADGNLVIYGADGRADWDSETSHDDDELGPREYELVMQNNGDLTLYDVGVGLPLWVNGEKIARGDELSENWSDTRALEYIASYPDLMDRIGSDDDHGRSHFMDSGISENRITTFNATNYLAANPDLVEAFGTDTEKAAKHWIDIGRYEGRSLAPGEPPQEPVPALSFEDASGDGRGILTLPDVDGVVEDERIEDYTAYSLTGRGTVKLSDGRRFVVERDEGGVPFPATDYGNTLTGGQISANESITSENGRYKAVFQTDGNFVVYDLEHEGGPKAIWATGTDGDAELGVVAMQRDGNLVVYDSFEKSTLPENAEWSSRTNHEDGEANRDFSLVIGNDGQLSVRDSENNGAVLWTSGGGHIQDAPGIPRATATEIRPDGTPPDPLAGEPYLLNGEAFDAEIPDGAVPADYQEAVIQLMTWFTTGFISNDQFNAWSNDLEILSGLQQVIAEGGGRFDVAGGVELELRDMADMTPFQIAGILDEGFDLQTGPSAEQLTALNTLAKGNDSAFIEVLTAYTLKHHPDLDLRFSYNGVNNGDRYGSITFRGPEDQVETPFINWLGQRFDVFDRKLRNSFTSMEYSYNSGRHTRTRSVIERDDDGDYSGSVSLTPSFNVIQEISTDAEAQTVYDIFGMTEAFGEEPRRSGKHELIGDDGQVLGYAFSVRGNKDHDLFEGFGSNMARDAIETFDPEAIGGSTTFLINATGETVANSSDLGDMTVIEQGGSDNKVLAGAGDLIYSTTGATGGILRPGGGQVIAIADDSNLLRIEDVVDREDNATIVRYTGNNTGTFQFTDDGINAVSIEEGTTQGFVIQANGTIQIELASGANVSESLFLFNGADGTFLAQDGSTLTASTVFGSDEEDQFIFNGHVEGTYVRTNGGNDYIEIGENFSGNFDARDNAASWMWQNGDEVFENDTVLINGSIAETMQDEGWTLVEGPGGSPDKLVHYDEPDANGDRAILAQITLSGDSEEIENIVVSDGDGNFTSLQEVPPEVRSKLAALGLISSVLMVVGAVFPPAAIAGAVLKFTYDAANNNLSFQNALLTAASVAGAGNGIGGLGGGNAIAPAWVSPALSAGANVLQGDWANFTKNLFLTGAGVQAERLMAAQDAARVAEGAELAPALSAVNDAANPTIEFAKLAEGTEAAIMTVEGLTEEDGWQIAEGVFLLGASVAGDGSRQLLLGGADAAKIGAAIESGSLSAVTSATAGFLANQGIFNEEPLNIENTPFVTPRDPNKVVGILNGVSMVVGFDEAINNGDSVGQALVAAFPGFLETATNFTGQNPVQVLFGNLNNEVEGRSRLGGNELLILKYDDETEPGVMTPVSIHGADGREIGEIEEAANGTYNYYLPDENGVVTFAFNHDPTSDADPIEERALTAEELEEPAQVDDPNFEPNANLFNPYVQEIQIDPAVYASLTDQQKTIFNTIVDSANGSPRALMPVLQMVRELTPEGMDAFLDDILNLDDMTEVDRIVRENAGGNFLGLVWQFSDQQEKEEIQAAIERRYEDGTLTEHLGKFTIETQTFEPGVPPAGADQLSEMIGSIDNADLAADYRYITDDNFSAMYNAVPESFDISKTEFNELPEYSQIGLVLGDHAFIEEASQYDDPYTQQRILNYIIITTAMDSPERFWNSVKENPLKFLGEAALEEIAENYIPGFNLYEYGSLGFNIIGGSINLNQQADAYFNAETPEERAEALRGVIGSTTQAVDPAVGFVATSGGFRAVDLGGRTVVSGYQAVTGNTPNSGSNTTSTPGSDTAPDGDDGTSSMPTFSDGTPLEEGATIVEQNAVVDGVEGTFYLDDWGQLNFSFVDAGGTRQKIDLGEVNVTEGRARVSDELAAEGITTIDTGTGQQIPTPTDDVAVEPVVTPVSDNLVSGTVTTTGENDVVQVEYTDSAGNIRSFELSAGTTPEQASEVLEYRYIRGDLEGLQPGFDPLTLVDGQTVDVIEENGQWYARIGDEVTALENAVTRDEATAQIRERGSNGTLSGADIVNSTDQVLIGGAEDISPYSLSLTAPSQTGAGGITATYEIGGQIYTVNVPSDQAVSYDEAQIWLTAQLEEGVLPGLLPTVERVPPSENVEDTGTNTDPTPNDTTEDTISPIEEPNPSTEDTTENTPPQGEETPSEEPTTDNSGGNDDNGGSPPVGTGGTPESDGDNDGENTDPVDPTNGTESNDEPVVDPSFAPIQPTDADGNVIPRVSEGELVVIQPDGSKSCGQHACSMVFDTLGQPVDVDTIISTNPTTNDSGTSIDDMNKLISDYGVEGESTFILDIDELRDATSGGQPVIAQVEIREDVFHYVVVDGVTEVDGQEVIAIRDSLGQTGDGVYYETPESFFRPRRFTALAIRFDGNNTPDGSTGNPQDVTQPNPTTGNDDPVETNPSNQIDTNTDTETEDSAIENPEGADPDNDTPQPDPVAEETSGQTDEVQSQLDPEQTITDPTIPDIESTTPQDITSITPPSDLNATNNGGGRRNWTEAELQAIRDYRAENNGALPEGIGIADLPTSFIQEIAGETDPGTSNTEQMVPTATSITLPDDWRNAGGGLTETQQSELSDIFTQLDISDPYARVDVAETYAAGGDLFDASVTTAGGIRKRPEASGGGELTEAQTAQIDELIGESPSLNSATNRTAILTRVRNGMSVNDAVNSVSRETNVLLDNLGQPEGQGVPDISDADAVALDQIYEALPGLSEGEQIAIEARVGDGMTPLEATADYLREARALNPEPVGDSLLTAIEANESAAGITDPSEIKFSPRLPGFSANPEYSRTSQTYTDALTGSLLEGARNTSEFGTPLPTFSQYARSLGDLRAQQSGSVPGSDPNGIYGELRTPDDNVLQTEIRGRYEPYRQRILDRALETTPFLQNNPNGGTVFIDGSEYGITNLSSLQVTPLSDGRSEVTFLSTRDVDLNRGREVLDTLFVEAQQASPDEAMDKIAEFAWVYFHVAPYTNGTAAIGQWTITSLMNAFGADYTSLKPGVALDLEAIASSKDSFVENFPSLFEGYQPPQYSPSSPITLEDTLAPIDETNPPANPDPTPPDDDGIPPADIDETGAGDLEDGSTGDLENSTAPVDENTPPINSGDPVDTGDPDETGSDPSTILRNEPPANPIDVTVIDPDPAVDPIADIDQAELDFDNPVPIDLRTAPGEIVLAPDGSIETLQPFDFSSYEEPLRAPEIGENIPDTPFNPIKIVLDAANQGLEAGRDAVVQAFDAAGAKLLETGGFQWLLGQPALYNDISGNITYDENGNATIDTTQVSPDLLERLSDARLDPRISLALGTNLPIASSPGVGSVSVFASPRTLQRLRRDFPQLVQALQSGDMGTVRTILGEAFGLSGDALQGLLDPQVTDTVLQELADRGLEGIPLPEPVEDAIDSLAVGRNGYFYIKTGTLDSSSAFQKLPNGGWSLTGREIQQTELGTVPPLNSAGRPTQAGDFILDVDLPLDEAAIQNKIGPLFTHTEYSRSDLETMGLSLTIPAGTPIPASLYNFIDARISNPVNIATFSSPGVPFANSQRVYMRARDFEFRLDKLDEQPFTRSMIEDTLLHINGLNDPAYLVTGDLATASASIVSWKLPFSVGIPYLGSVKLGATLYSRSQAQGDPNAGLRDDTAPLNVEIELSSEGSAFALSIENPKRIAGFQFDNPDAPTSISVETVDIDSLIDEPGASTQASDISVIGVNKLDGETAFVPAPDSLISILQGEPLTDRARSEAAGFLALYAALPDPTVRDAAIAALESLEIDAVGAPVNLDSSIAIGQMLQTAADLNRIPELPNVPEE